MAFCEWGEFKPTEGAKTKRVFRLHKVKNQFEGKTYDELESKDRINLENAVIHATIVKQDSPAEDDTSIYHIFERLNSGGRKLTPQEIRVAVYHGKLIDLVKNMNMIQPWRDVFGPSNDRMKDVELILRFLAMRESWATYTKPMVEFINKFCSANRNPDENKLKQYEKIFTESISILKSSVGPSLFRPARALNVALYEACMIGISERLINGGDFKESEVNDCYCKLMTDSEFIDLISQSTSDVKNLKRRMEISINTFSGDRSEKS